MEGVPALTTGHKNRKESKIFLFKSSFKLCATKQSRSAFTVLKLLWGTWYLFLHTQGIAMETFMPPCLLCCHRSHPRIVSLLVPSWRLWLTHKLKWKPQCNLRLIRVFFFFSFFRHILFCSNQAACLSESWAYAHVYAGYVCMGMWRSALSGEFLKINNAGLLW